MLHPVRAGVGVSNITRFGNTPHHFPKDTTRLKFAYLRSTETIPQRTLGSALEQLECLPRKFVREVQNSLSLPARKTLIRCQNCEIAAVALLAAQPYHSSSSSRFLC